MRCHCVVTREQARVCSGTALLTPGYQPVCRCRTPESPIKPVKEKPARPLLSLSVFSPSIFMSRKESRVFHFVTRLDASFQFPFLKATLLCTGFLLRWFLCGVISAAEYISYQRMTDVKPRLGCAARRFCTPGSLLACGLLIFFSFILQNGEWTMVWIPICAYSSSLVIPDMIVYRITVTGCFQQTWVRRKHVKGMFSHLPTWNTVTYRYLRSAVLCR